jgi:hypothetical protein
VPKVSTLAELRARVAFEGDFPNSSKFTPAILTAKVNEGIEETWGVLTDARPDYYTQEQTPAPVTVAGVDQVVLPLDLLHLRKVELMDGDRAYKLMTVNLAEAHRVRRGSARPVRYRIQGTNLKLYPTPEAAYTLRIYYIPAFTNLVETDDFFDGINGFEDHAVALAIYRLKLREQMPVGEWLGEVQRLERKMRGDAKLDVGEPYYLSGGGRRVGSGSDDWELP